MKSNLVAIHTIFDKKDLYLSLDEEKALIVAKEGSPQDVFVISLDWKYANWNRSINELS